MCPPGLAAVMPFLSAGLSIVSGLADASAQSQQADQQEAYQNAVYQRTQESANNSFLRQAEAEQQSKQQAREAAANDAFETRKDALQAKATAATAAGEAGVSGLSVDALLADFDRQSLVHTEVVKRNLTFSELQGSNNILGFDAQRMSRINSAIPGPVSRPSFLGSALKIGANAYSAYQTTKGPTPDNSTPKPTQQARGSLLY